MALPLMPKATAVWLIDNTSLTFEQIAEFTGLHSLEITGIADGDVAQGIKGLDPISSGLLTRSEIERCQQDPTTKLTSTKRPSASLPEQKKKGSRYTPISKRQDKPDAINWLLRNHPELTDAQIVRLIGTTKNTINAVRDRTHWNSSNLQLIDPVALGLCSQLELDGLVAKANANRVVEPSDEPGLAPVDVAEKDEEVEHTAQSVFGTKD
ncbi:MAG TPA: DUF1013 domain-containing protein [Alphaproteobacteria bacterium]|nr:hypothetical protein [Paracoccaceae bacterium]RCL80326.1 MAG: DUF1013 domain-containing protein [SAR116 cluster bacterium]HBQ22838.1 DUF1013 domain-containing protein [Alphaproteobacteria bacterium]HCJ61602.1 DUF1013 domain-containing protein [Alphaproteobacteria bacterium]HCY48031.1 DUF1013 domain-containing protein [Alphaproteobacteria bacterium]|tara:strand:- start:1882 stop:2511 length:630 start_codon:yes stop_codon:yes gene_type:complete